MQNDFIFKYSNCTISITIQNYTHVQMNFFFSQWPILPPPKVLIFHLESSFIKLTPSFGNIHAYM